VIWLSFCVLPLTVCASGDVKEGRSVSVLVSVKPLALIAQELVGERAHVETLISAGQSPHHYSLTVTDRQKIEEADLVVWVGPELERFLEKPLRSARNSVALFGLTSHEEVKEGEHDHGAETHPWLAPDQAAAIAQTITAELIKQNPEASEGYHNNLKGFLASLDVLDAQVIEQFQDIEGQDSRYAVAHDAFRGLTDHYRLPEPFVLSANPELAPGARKLWQLQKALPAGTCLLVGVEHHRRWVDSVTKSQKLLLKRVDTLAADPKVSTYNQYILDIAAIFKECLGAG
jgi:zinc transport system substrate-binding protein